MRASSERDGRLRLLYESHGEDLKGYCRRRLGPDEAEDALAEVFAVAWRRLDEVPPGNEARLWLYGVARNVVRNSMRGTRRRRRLATRLVGSTDPPRSGPVETLMTRAEHEAVLAALLTLRSSDQELLRLHAWEDLSRADISRILGVSVGAVDMRLHRAIARMGRALETVGNATREDSIRRAEDRGGES